jgi:hypothetical protein
MTEENNKQDFCDMLEVKRQTQYWRGIPGLRNKYFTLHGDSNRGALFYTWTNEKEMNEYMDSALWKDMSKLKHFSEMTYSISEILVGSECCMEL